MSFVADGAVDRSFGALMLALAECYPSVRLREGTIRMYAEQLADLTLAQVQAAMDRAVKESEFFPTVAMIRKQVVLSADDAALLAWSALQQAVSSAGAYASVEVEDASAAEALLVVFGSWPEFCELDDGPALALKRQEFLAAYRQARRRPRIQDARLVRLPGLCEADGHTAGALAPATWVTTVTRDGKAVPHRDHAALAPGADLRRLTGGDQ